MVWCGARDGWAGAPLIALLLALSVLASAATCGAQAIDALPPSEGVRDVLGPGDVIEVRVFGEAELSGVHEVSQQGAIRLPLVGEMKAAGRSPEELRLEIELAYNARFLKNAEVNLLVKEMRSRQVYVLGQVGKPGPIAVDGRITVIEAIARAGGTTKMADANRTLLTRERDGRQVRVLVQVADIGTGQAPDVELQPGDILFVPESVF